MPLIMRTVLTAVAIVAAVAARAQGPEIAITPAPEAASFEAGTEARVLVRVALTEGWKTNSNAPLDDFLIPTELTLDTMPGGVSLRGIVYPEPKEHFLQGSDEPMAVFGERFDIGAVFALADDLEPGEHTIEGSLRYQACDDVQCWRPMTEPVTITLTVGEAAAPDPARADAFDALDWDLPEPVVIADDRDPDAPLAQTVMQGRNGPEVSVAIYAATAAPGETGRLVIAAHLEDGWHMNSHEPLDRFLIPTEVTLEGDGGFRVTRLIYPEGIIETFDFSPDPMSVYEHDFSIGAEFVADAPATVTMTLRYQACDDAQCLPPHSDSVSFTLPILAGTPADTPQPAAFAAVDWDAPGVVPDAPGETVAEERDAAAAIVAADTPLTPEGHPDWPALLADFEIAGQDGGFMNARQFIAFIDAAESGEGMGPSRIETAGAWGRILITLIGGLLLNLTPCVLPLIPINLAIIGAGARASSRARGFALGGAYGLGITAVFGGLGLIVVFGLGTFGGGINSTIWFNALIAVLFIVLGLAMFDLIRIDFSKYQTKIGQRGKKGTVFFALFMGGVSALLAGACVAPVLIAVLLYAQDAYAQGNIEGLYLPFLLGLGMALPWPFAGGGLSMMPKPGGWMSNVKYAIGLFIIGFGAYYGYQTYKLIDDRYFVDPAAVAASMEAADEYGWRTELVPAMAEARAEGKPLLIDFWATWCKNCLVMNDTTFKDEAVLDRLDGFVKVKYQAEDPSASPHAELLAEFERYIGFPFFVVLTPR